ncbi:DUF4157 domain-containing protein [Arachidicoccus soli]|uniref:DUF4157 domain-containing protein n=1 Tax=Arachidicoccus soli TaxID=2341117 RepID=A0A386HRY2_9BACT|nr:DUF4157 domain-containing protein [Arachidicoccus soli]AYD48615.1 DUF4157 domain-containing protein [Arachidicoccus soli]
MKIKVIENSVIAKLAAFKLKEKRVAITMGNKIYLFGVNKEAFMKDEPWVRHELTHVQQFEKYGFAKFIGKYLLESFKKGYYNNKWEEEARRAETSKESIDLYEFV